MEGRRRRRWIDLDRLGKVGVRMDFLYLVILRLVAARHWVRFVSVETAYKGLEFCKRLCVTRPFV